MIKIPALQQSLRAWLLEGPLSVAAATPAMPSLRERRISPHTIRHTTLFPAVDER